jgi:hypothetical protein
MAVKKLAYFGFLATAAACLAACDSGLNSGESRRLIQEQEAALHIAIDRFAAESFSASEGSVVDLANRLSKLRQLQLDIKSISPVSACEGLHSEVMALSSDIISTWSSVTSVPTPESGGLYIKVWDFSVGTLVSFATKQTQAFRIFGDLECADDEALNQVIKEIEGLPISFLDAVANVASDQAVEVCDPSYGSTTSYTDGFLDSTVRNIEACGANEAPSVCLSAEIMTRIVEIAKPCIVENLAREEHDVYSTRTEQKKKNMAAIEAARSLSENSAD